MAITGLGFTAVVYVDDINSFKHFPLTTFNNLIKTELIDCQANLHRWGFANQVTFDASKEQMAILSHTNDASGDPVRLLGIEFDVKLQMGVCIAECIHEANWRIRTVLRSRRFYSDKELVLHFKSHILSFLEYRTATIYHAASTILTPLDRVLDCFFYYYFYRLASLYDHRVSNTQSNTIIIIQSKTHKWMSNKRNSWRKKQFPISVAMNSTLLH